VVVDLLEGRRSLLTSLQEVLSFSTLLRVLLCILDDKKLGSVLKKMSMTSINAVEEVNIFKNDGSVIHITGPKSMSFLFFNFVISSLQ
jgi:hypothetical protein